ncbi:hypothetical protein BS50DRAFT_655716 [Corynespora cassiicola Philippines]|uniref:Uncharacterized protein n=1 Tax=Corynespora cassiicola Philippines TaxID=1448308 RepID=A0A2T2N419_CORCC|nr:hypothetical protein BS50DRAFT_655716 [Corynespora cassiicola Philippines]
MAQNVQDVGEYVPFNVFKAEFVRIHHHLADPIRGLRKALRYLPGYQGLEFVEVRRHPRHPVIVVIGPNPQLRHSQPRVRVGPDGSIWTRSIEDLPHSTEMTNRLLSGTLSFEPPFYLWERSFEFFSLRGNGSAIPLAFIRLYCMAWAIDNNKMDIKLPLPGLDDLVQAIREVAASSYVGVRPDVESSFVPAKLIGVEISSLEESPRRPANPSNSQVPALATIQALVDDLRAHAISNQMPGIGTMTFRRTQRAAPYKRFSLKVGRYDGDATSVNKNRNLIAFLKGNPAKRSPDVELSLAPRDRVHPFIIFDTERVAQAYSDPNFRFERPFADCLNEDVLKSAIKYFFVLLAESGTENFDNHDVVLNEHLKTGLRTLNRRLEGTNRAPRAPSHRSSSNRRDNPAPRGTVAPSTPASASRNTLPPTGARNNPPPTAPRSNPASNQLTHLHPRGSRNSSAFGALRNTPAANTPRNPHSSSTPRNTPASQSTSTRVTPGSRENPITLPSAKHRRDSSNSSQDVSLDGTPTNPRNTRQHQSKRPRASSTSNPSKVPTGQFSSARPPAPAPVPTLAPVPTPAALTFGSTFVLAFRPAKLTSKSRTSAANDGDRTVMGPPPTPNATARSSSSFAAVSAPAPTQQQAQQEQQSNNADGDRLSSEDAARILRMLRSRYNNLQPPVQRPDEEWAAFAERRGDYYREMEALSAFGRDMKGNKWLEK